MNKGSFKIFSLFGIGVYVHWMWFLAAFYSIQYRTHAYSSLGWVILEYLSLFVIVLMHEFGHQLACRQVGGKTYDIVLWLLGGAARVSPPERPGAQLWSVAGGPLVNVILIPVLSILVSASSHLGWYDTHPDAYDLLHNIWWINIGLLVLNLMPVYPLDGGQILRALLWFVIGRIKSLLVASVIGFIGLAGLVVLTGWFFFEKHDSQSATWSGLMAIFVAVRSWGGLKEAWELSRLAKLPRHAGFACPTCKAVPPMGELWRCGKCGGKFDAFVTAGVCPHCRIQFNATQCLDCGNSSPITGWIITPPKVAKLIP